MGNQATKPTDGTNVTLDELGGYYRPAVLRKNELDVKANWLGEAVLAQADKMETELQLKAFTSKEHAMMSTGGSNNKGKRFGNASGKFSFGSTQKSDKAAEPPVCPSGRPTTVQNTPPEALLIPSSGSGLTTARSCALSPTPRQPMQRPGTAAASMSVSKSMELPSTASPYKQALPPHLMGPSARRKAAAAAAAAKAAQDAAEEEFKANHWRRRVERAKRRLYHYLIAYMAWISVLKKKRVGYADALTVDVLPVHLSNVLGEMTNQVGAGLSACATVMEASPEAHAMVTALNGGRAWLARARAHRMTTSSPTHSPGGSGVLKPRSSKQPMDEDVAASSTQPATHGQLQGSEVVGKTIPQNPTSVLATRPLTQVGKARAIRGGARALVAAGAGAHALQQAGLVASTQQHAESAKLQQAGNEDDVLPKRSSLTQRNSLSTRQSGEEQFPRRRGLKPLTAEMYAKEVEAVRRLTALYIKRGKQKQLCNKEKNDLAFLAQHEHAALQVLINKALSRWIERHMAATSKEVKGGWNPPIVIESKTLAAGGVDVASYQKLSGTLLSEGKVAVMMTYLGEELPMSVDKHSGNEVLEPCISSDLWKGVQQLFAHKLPSTPYLSGLTLLDRRMLQCIIDAEKQGGAAALMKLTVILAIDAAHTSWVAEQCVGRGHWGLKHHQIIIVPIASLPGMLWDTYTKTFKLNYGSTYTCAGTGYAFLALAWPSQAFFMSTAGREYIAGSTLQLLAGRKVHYLYSTLMCDQDCLTPTCPAVDANLVGPAIYAMDLKGANIAMQVVCSSSANVARSTQSIVLAREAHNLHCCNISYADIQSANTRTLLTNQINSGSVVSCVSRYMIQVKHLQRILTGPSAFKMKVQNLGPHLHVSLDASDMTSHQESRTVAVLGKGTGPQVNVKELARDWLKDMIPILTAQDAQPAMRVRLAKLSTCARPGVSGMTVAAGQDISTSSSTAQSSSSRILIFVKDNAASRCAFRLAMSLLGGRDTLRVVTVLTQDGNEADGMALLNTFTDVIANEQIQRKVIRQQDKLMDTLLREVDSFEPGLVVLGSQVLSTAAAQTDIRASQSALPLGSTGAGLATSVAVSLAKSLADVPLLVAKTNSSGDVLQSHQGSGTAGAAVVSKKVLVEVTSSNASLAMMRWLAARLIPDRDKLLLAKPNSIDKVTGKESLVAQRITQAFLSEAQAFKWGSYAVKKLTMAEGPTEGFPPLVVSERCDVLGVMAPNAKVTPQHVIELLRTTKAAVLIWRQKAVTESTS